MNGSPTEPLAVGALNRISRTILETRFQQCWVRGELIALSIPSSGHWYFTLKDSEGQISCALFKYRTPHAVIAVGTEVVLCGTVTLYEPRGQYQMIVESVVPWGIGQRHVEFAALKKKLLDEGILDAAQKKPLPRFPRCIAIISSLQAAGLQDVLVILKRRYALARIVLYPSLVQGDMAPEELLRALRGVARDAAHIDVLMVVRGGGSPEDLWCFNNERVVRCMAALSVPIITGIGHEVDTTLADLVADVRAPTPSAAAEMVVMDALELLATLKQWTRRLRHTLQSRVDHLCLRLDSLRLRLEQPLSFARMYGQKILHVRHMLHHVTQRSLLIVSQRLALCGMHMLRLHPLQQLKQHMEQLRWRLAAGTQRALLSKQQQLAVCKSTLCARDPALLLQGGWSWVEGEHGVLKDISQMHTGSRWRLWVLGGMVEVAVV